MLSSIQAFVDLSNSGITPELSAEWMRQVGRIPTPVIIEGASTSMVVPPDFPFNPQEIWAETFFRTEF